MSLIKVESISKKYRLNSYRSDRLKDLLFKRRNRSEEKDFWALKDISFEVEKGERIGLIGRNGAGKSTLLKILSSITTPTEGRFKLEGRIVSLLEVGSGFHPELTGRENIFLYGAILGMSKREISACFDEIVQFSEIERFLDLPLKRYSSGMYARLGFSVAIHVSPDILIVDEVFSVGDQKFQDKCVERLQQLGKKGATLFFVGHHLPQLMSICHRGLLLDQGRLLFDGPVEQCAELYGNNLETSRLNGTFQIKSAQLKNECLEMDLINGGDEHLTLGIEILNASQQIIAFSNFENISPGKKKGQFKLDSSLFHPGIYTIRVHFGKQEDLVTERSSLTLNFPVYRKLEKEELNLKEGVQGGISLGNPWSMYDN